MTPPPTEATTTTPEAGAEPTVVTTVDAGVATVRINRPDAMNALDIPTKEALRDSLAEVAEDPAVRCVVLTGTGRAFCVGQDLRLHIEALKSRDESLWTTVPEHYNPVAELLATMNKPVVAAINGVAAGAGASFALAADFRIMSDDAGMNLAFAGIALSVDSGGSFWLPRLVGPAKAKELLLLPRTVPAQECLDLGLVTSVVPGAELEAAVADLTARLAAGPTLAYGSIRRAVAYSLTHTLTDSLAYEATLMDLTGSSADHHAAVDAFLSRTTPTFSGT